MKAMIFAAGLGTRLAPLTDSCPKALIEVGGKPMLRRVIERLRDAGVGEMVVNVHHHADMIRRYLEENDFGVRVMISDESDMLLDTGGGVARASILLEGDEPVMLYNADIFTDFPIAEMVAVHERSGADVTLLADSRDTSRYLMFDEAGYMRGWKNVRTGEVRSPFPTEVTDRCRLLAFGGIHIISQSAMRDISGYRPGEKFSITPFYIDRCGVLSIQAYIPTSPYKWIDIGKPETLQQAREEYISFKKRTE
ncbi:nucleotidyltransferase family protein [Duncaniella freteri]|uniref:nucleotidyltransferase family protein n=2 Tax=Duncaniella TaxID=2518495 RepID=UPI002572407D|nr:nucleotidyltransferase family protein [Duncaniella freteri]